MTNPNSDISVIIRLKISGHVQGVGYRAWAQKMAKALLLDGWVRNRRDGSVEVVASGTGRAIGRFIAQCHEGPHGARVESMATEPAQETIGSGFAIRPTV